MKSLNIYDLTPNLQDVEITYGTKDLFIEAKHQVNCAVLPLEAKEVIKHINGQNSIKDLVDAYYQSCGQVSIKTVLNYLEELNDKKLLDQNYPELSAKKSNPIKEVDSFLKYSLLSVSLLRKFTLEKKLPGAILLSLSALIFSFAGIAIYQFLNLKLEEYLKFQNYHHSLILFFGITSFLMVAKGLLNSLMVLIETKYMFALALKLYPYGVSLQSNDEIISGSTSKKHKLLFLLTSPFCYLFASGVCSLLPLPQNIQHDILITAIILTYIDLNPYRKSDAIKVFNYFFKPDLLGNIFSLHKEHGFKSFGKNNLNLKDEARIVSYSFFALAWAVSFMLFSFDLILTNINSLTYQFQFGDTEQILNASIIVTMLLGLSFYLGKDLIHTITKNILSPLTPQIRKVRNKAEHIDYDKKVLASEFKKNILISHLDESKITELLSIGKVYSYEAGFSLYEDGDYIDSIYYVIEGSLEVSKENQFGMEEKISSLYPGDIIGIEQILEAKSAQNKVSAHSKVILLKFHLEDIQHLLNKEDKKLLKKISLCSYAAKIPLFQNIPTEKIAKMIFASEVVNFPEGYNLVEQGEKDKSFFIIISGQVEIIKDEKSLKTLQSGDFFGELALITNSPRSASVKTLKETQLLIICSKEFWKLMHENLELALAIEDVGQKRIREAA